MTKQLDVEMERDIEVLNLTAPRITPEQIDELMAGVTYHTQVIPGTTTTVATAIAANGFTLAIGMTACADPANFNAEFGAKYAIRDAESKARGELWKLEGWCLKQQLHEQGCSIQSSHIDRMRQERVELCDRLNKLSNFIATEKFTTLAANEQSRMKRQLVAMREYAEVLGERLQYAAVDNQKVLTDADALADLNGTPRPDNPSVVS
ncbi:Gp49 family protein [Aeromonas hydrophila]|uniref:Gp49 family protein n=1 Tax=Aeromonas hydrophila TaxID=644 RepID=UPI00069075F4|nr:Gp49 family protein [Aeromonas hydrophila]OCA67432.1 hypothetical protein A9R12_01950 [Aeromonas hydrophila]CAD7530251.1 hypothetical protein KBAH04_17780 [Aeromonas hydrophila]